MTVVEYFYTLACFPFIDIQKETFSKEFLLDPRGMHGHDRLTIASLATFSPLISRHQQTSANLLKWAQVGLATTGISKLIPIENEVLSKAQPSTPPQTGLGLCSMNVKCD